MADILAYRMTRPWFVNNFVNLFSPKYFKERKTIKTLHAFTRSVITDREKKIKNFDLHGKRRLAMLDLLLTAKNVEGIIDDGGIREEVDTFMLEGHDTTSVVLGFALMLIACNKHVQVKSMKGDFLE